MVSAGAGAHLWRQWKSRGDLRFGESRDTVSEKIALPQQESAFDSSEPAVSLIPVSPPRKHIGTAEFVATGAAGVENHFPLFALLLKCLLQDWDQSILKDSGKRQKGAGNLTQAYQGKPLPSTGGNSGCSQDSQSLCLSSVPPSLPHAYTACGRSWEKVLTAGVLSGDFLLTGRHSLGKDALSSPMAQAEMGRLGSSLVRGHKSGRWVNSIAVLGKSFPAQGTGYNSLSLFHADCPPMAEPE